MVEFLKKSLKWILYFLGIFFIVISINFFQKENLPFAIAFIVMSFVTYSFLIIKDFKFLSVIAYITLVLSIFTIMMFAGGEISDENTFATVGQERAFYITFGVLIPLTIFLCTYLITMGGWRKTLSYILLVISIIASFIMGIGLPGFHNNFVYTRIFIGTVFIYSIYLILKKEKLSRIGGIIGVISCILVLLFSSMQFFDQVYIIEGAEKEQVIGFMEPKIQHMFQSYNQGDLESFCDPCSENLKIMVNEEIFERIRNMYGEYISHHEEPDIIRTGGSYYIEYTVSFRIMNPIYFTFVIEGVAPENTIQGFDSSPEQTQKAQ